jgi:hypothetical protein
MGIPMLEAEGKIVHLQMGNDRFIRKPGGQTILLCVFVEAPGKVPEKHVSRIAAAASELVGPH